jgi:hypothetical protein
VSIEKPPAPAATAGPTCWFTPPSSAARCIAAEVGRGDRCTPHAASTMVFHPVQRQTWATSALRTAGSSHLPGVPMAARRMTMPGVQKPHWLAPCASNAAHHAAAVSRPSRVITLRPLTRDAGVTQATRGTPSTQTVQQPHCPCGLQPSLAERSPKRSRTTSSSDQPSSSTWTCSPFSWKASGRAVSVRPLR